eukprot:m.338684 g.338684  ORF g.338684 m.338684 type:complete len:446 (+) comp18504_c0_seq1:101-1438(+)
MASKVNNWQEFQAVILAGGNGNGLDSLTNQIPKPMLPVGNIPMIEYSLRLLDKHGFQEVHVIAQEKMSKAIMELLDDQLTAPGHPPLRIKIDLTTIPDDSDMGTADALRLLADKIYTDFIVLSCDVITNLQLFRLFDVHRVNNATVTMTFSEPSSTPENTGYIDRDVVGIDPKSKRVVLLTTEADIDGDNLPVKTSLMNEYPRIQVRKNLNDAHIYVFAKWVMDVLKEKKKISAIKRDLVPYLVRKQFATPVAGMPGKTREPMSMAPADPNADLFSKNARTPRSSQVLKCYSIMVTPEDTFCIRANTTQAYKDVNRQIASYMASLIFKDPDSVYANVNSGCSAARNAQIGSDSLVSTGTQIGSRCSVKRSIIGKHCSLSEKVKITNSVIMDHVTIAGECVIENSIICQSAHILAKCSLKHCLVGVSHSVPEGTKSKDEALGFDYM